MIGDDSKPGKAETPDPSTEEKECKAWDSVISSTRKWRDDAADAQGWKRFIKEFQGKWEMLEQNLDIPAIPINHVFSWVKTEIARLYMNDPWITVNAKRVEDLGASNIAETIINYTWGEIDLKRQAKLALLEALIVGHGWIKVGYTANFGIVEAKEPAKKWPGRPKKEVAEVDVNEFVKSENVFATHYPWTDVLFDPMATWPPHHNARWIAFRWVKPLRAVKDSHLYRNTEDLQSADMSAIYGKPNESQPYGRNIQAVVGWEIWDKDHDKVVTIVPGHSKYLREIPWPEELKDVDGNPVSPAVMLSFNPVPGEVYPVSDIKLQEPLLLEKIKARSIQVNHLKRWNRQIFTKPDLMTPENKNNFKQSIDGAIIEIQGNPQTDFFIPPYAPVQSDVYGIENAIDQDLREVAGQSPMDKGAPFKTNTRSVWEARTSLAGSGSRAEERRDVLEDFLAEIARKLLGIIQKKFDIPKIARIVGNKSLQQALMANSPNAKLQQASGAEGAFAVSWNKEDVQGEMDVDVLAGSTAPLDKESQIDQIEMLAKSGMLQAAGITPGSPAARALAREFFRLMNIKSLENIMDLVDQQMAKMPGGAPPNPMAQKMQMEQQKTQMKMQADAQKSQVQMQGIKAKTEATIIKAKVDEQKSKMKLQEQVLGTILKQFSTPPTGEENNGNGHG
jgi:hypothetical protein